MTGYTYDGVWFSRTRCALFLRVETLAASAAQVDSAWNWNAPPRSRLVAVVYLLLSPAVSSDPFHRRGRLPVGGTSAGVLGI